MTADRQVDCRIRIAGLERAFGANIFTSRFVNYYDSHIPFAHSKMDTHNEVERRPRRIKLDGGVCSIRPLSGTRMQRYDAVDA